MLSRSTWAFWIERLLLVALVPICVSFLLLSNGKLFYCTREHLLAIEQFIVR